MPLSRAGAAQFAAELAQLYRNAEEQIGQYITGRLRRGLGTESWAYERSNDVGAVRRFVQGLLNNIGERGQTMAVRAISTAMVSGRQSAIQEVRRQLASRPALDSSLLNGSGGFRGTGIVTALGSHQVPGADRTAVLAAQLSGQLRNLHPQIVRDSVSAYRTVVDRASASVTLGVQTQRQAAGAAWADLVRNGYTKIQTTSAAGRTRNWEVSSYVDMATRTAVVQASVESHLNTLEGAGIDLVQVSNTPAECPLCRPWEGKILLTSGQPGEQTIKRQHGINDDQEVSVRVAGTVSEARDAGLFHPNCRHSLGAYIPGVSSPITNTADPDGAAARDKLRALERQTRQAKLAENTALSPEERAAARARVQQAQGRIRGHLAANPGLQRQPGREQINQGHGLLTGQERRQLAAAPPAKVAAKAVPSTPAQALVDMATPPGHGPLPNRTVRPIGELITMGQGSGSDRQSALRQMSRAINGTYGSKGLRAEVNDLESVSGDRATVSGWVLGADGSPAGSFVRTFDVDDRGQRYAYHKYLKIDGNNQGSGFAEEFNRNLYDWYRRSGISYVNVHANIDVGGYTWATQGFEFQSAGEYAAFSGQVRSKIARHRAGIPLVYPFQPIPDDQVDALEKYLDSIERGDVTASAYDISQFGRQPGQGGRGDTWAGKWAMLGTSWHGRLRL